MLVDQFSPDTWFDIHSSPAFQRYHSRLVNGLPDLESKPAPEIDADHPDFQTEFNRVSQDWARPVVIRGGARASEAYRKWHSMEFWTSNWSKEEVLAYGGKNVEFVTIGSFFEALTN